MGFVVRSVLDTMGEDIGVYYLLLLMYHDSRFTRMFIYVYDLIWLVVVAVLP